LDEQFQTLTTLIVEMEESLKRKIRGVGERMDQMIARLDEIVATLPG
jgi:hypothetical protein